MIHYFTNREISIKLDINLARWKRWSRSFLPPDPLGGLQSGYARQYVFKDLFKVFLGGHLLSHLKLSIPDAQKVLADLAPWLKKAGFLELNGSVEKLKAKAGLDNPCRIYLRDLALANDKKATAFGYLIRKTIGTQPGPEGSQQVMQIIEEIILNCDMPDGRTFLQTPDAQLINLSALFDFVVERLAPC
jgi:hypothetical protein